MPKIVCGLCLASTNWSYDTAERRQFGMSHKSFALPKQSTVRPCPFQYLTMRPAGVLHESGDYNIVKVLFTAGTGRGRTGRGFFLPLRFHDYEGSVVWILGPIYPIPGKRSRHEGKLLVSETYLNFDKWSVLTRRPFRLRRVRDRATRRRRARVDHPSRILSTCEEIDKSVGDDLFTDRYICQQNPNIGGGSRSARKARRRKIARDRIRHARRERFAVQTMERRMGALNLGD